MKPINKTDIDEKTNGSKKSKKPPMSKGMAPVQPAPVETVEPVVAPKPVQTNGQQTDPEPQIQPVPTSTKKSRVKVAEKLSRQQAQLLEVESYEDAERLLSDNPDLIEPARAAFGAVVPTAHQNAFMDLAIRAAAEDDAASLGDALLEKRQAHLVLSTPEVKQLLEFASETATKSPQLALAMAILITDDLTQLKETDLWKSQKAIVTSAAERLGVDALAVWEEINGKAQLAETTIKSETPKKVKAEAVGEPAKPVKPATPKAKRHRNRTQKTVRYEIRRVDGPPKWLMATGILGLMTVVSCGVCSLAIL